MLFIRVIGVSFRRNNVCMAEGMEGGAIGLLS